MADNYCLAIDAMGGDLGPRVTVPASCDFLSTNPLASIVLLGDKALLERQLANHPLYAKTELSERITITHCEQVVSMEDKPAEAIRAKQQSSLKIGLDMLADDQVDGFVSAGNTGALVAMSVIGIGTLEDMQRPAICTAIPTKTGYAYMLDMGANPVCSPEQLQQFACVATRLYQLVEGKNNPTVGLLNIGVEAIKGTREIRDAAELIEQDDRLNYGGFVEGDGLFAGHVDIVVCDGFSGNIALKSVEGVAKMITVMLKEHLQKNWLRRLGAWFAKSAFKDVSQKVNPEQYNGACLLGLKKVVIKSHGATSRAGFVQAIEEAAKQVVLDVPGRLAS